ncbi:MAG: sugar-binding domain-containing protein, partial [bacterium]
KIPLLQDKLKRRFGLRDAIVIPTDQDCSLLLKNLAKAAADYFEKIVPARASVALGGGYLMYEMVARLPERHRDIDIYPAAIVGRGPSITHIDPMTLVTLLWAKSGHGQGRAHYITLTPPEIGSGFESLARYYGEFQKRKQVKPLLASMNNVDFVFASVGGIDASEAYLAVTRDMTKNLLDEMNLGAANRNKPKSASTNASQLSEAGAVGDLAYSFFDAEGRTKSEWNLATSIGIKRLKELSSTPDKAVVVVVGGYKEQSLNAVMQGRICNVLITDADGAEQALKDHL